MYNYVHSAKLMYIATINPYRAVVTNSWQAYWTVVMNSWQAKNKNKNEEEKSNFWLSDSNLGHTHVRPALYQLGYHSQWL